MMILACTVHQFDNDKVYRSEGLDYWVPRNTLAYALEDMLKDGESAALENNYIVVNVGWGNLYYFS